jgi:hypothetical protein
MSVGIGPRWAKVRLSKRGTRVSVGPGGCVGIAVPASRPAPDR